MKQFTPGPWEACAVDGGWDGVRPVYQEMPICNLVENNPANAQLIAAAPMMLEALEIALDLINELATSTQIGYLSDEENKKREAIKAAIRAARGE